MTNDKLIKAISTSRWNVELFETPSNSYVIVSETFRYGERKYSEVIKDYNTASFLFDLKVEELEGN